MIISKVEILPNNNYHERKLLCYATITLDKVVVIRDCKLLWIDGRYVLDFPSKKKTEHCPQCKRKNYLNANYCNECGVGLQPKRLQEGESAHHCIVLPITPEARKAITDAVVGEYQKTIHQDEPLTYREFVNQCRNTR